MRLPDLSDATTGGMPVGGTGRSSARALVRELIQRSYVATCALITVRNLVEKLQFNLGNIDSSSGTLHSAFRLADSVAYIDAVYQDYRTYGGMRRFHGRIAEVGPGDNCGVGMLFRLDGCERVDLVDRFYCRRDTTRQAGIYASLIERHCGLGQLFSGADLTDESTFAGLHRHYGHGASAEEFFVTSKGYDFIVSRAVGEHMYDPIAAMKAMIGALNPEGMMLHKIDLRDHGLLSARHHELAWLEVPDWVYRGMSGGSGRPNRVLAHRYREALTAAGVDYELLVTRLAGVGEITPHISYDRIDAALRDRAESYVESVRPRLARSLRHVASRDLAITGLFLVARAGRASAQRSSDPSMAAAS